MAHHDPRTLVWQPPDLTDTDGDDIPGAAGGSRIFEQPRHRAEVDRLEAFVAAEGPVACEIGFDHGRRLLSLAQQDPGVRWVGMEVRKRQVWALEEKAPANLLPWRVDARIAFRHVMPTARLSRVDILFPTPWWDKRKRAQRFLVTPAFVRDLRRALAPDGFVYLATDVELSLEWMAAQFAHWRPTEVPPAAPHRSRREASCHRDALPVWQGAWRPPVAGASWL